MFWNQYSLIDYNMDIFLQDAHNMGNYFEFSLCYTFVELYN